MLAGAEWSGEIDFDSFASRLRGTAGWIDRIEWFRCQFDVAQGEGSLDERRINGIGSSGNVYGL